jgi:hypothetical protein
MKTIFKTALIICVIFIRIQTIVGQKTIALTSNNL